MWKTRKLSDRLGISIKQINNWCMLGLVVDLELPGSGKDLVFNFKQVTDILVANELHKLGFSFKSIKKYVSCFRESGKEKVRIGNKFINIVIDGSKINNYLIGLF